MAARARGSSSPRTSSSGSIADPAPRRPGPPPHRDRYPSPTIRSRRGVRALQGWAAWSRAVRSRLLGRAGVTLLAASVAVGGAFVAARIVPAGPTCGQTLDHPGWSVARRWDEALLDAIRRALPNPPVHARNLYHLSIAMWDA